MKLSTKLGAIGAAGTLAVLISAAPAMAAPTPTGGTTVTAAIDDVIGVDISGDGTDHTASFAASLDPTSADAATLVGGTVTVSANVPYTLTASAAKLSDGTHTLANALQITDAYSGASETVDSTVDAPADLSADAITIGRNTAAGTADAFAITFSQKAVLTDVPSDGYSTTVTYTATAIPQP